MGEDTVIGGHIKPKEDVMREVESSANLSGDGYMTAMYNMMFLLQMNVVKIMKGDMMDPEIFRTYFIRLFRSMTQMEKKFFEALQPAE